MLLVNRIIIVPDYKLPSGSYGHKNDRESNNSDTLGKNYSKIACNDYEAIQNLMSQQYMFTSTL